MGCSIHPLTELAEWAICHFIQHLTVYAQLLFVCTHAACVYLCVTERVKMRAYAVCICSVWKLSGLLTLLVADGITAWMPFLLQYGCLDGMTCKCSVDF